jgi:LysM repeat protein
MCPVAFVRFKMYYLKELNITDLDGFLNQDRCAKAWAIHTNQTHYPLPLSIRLLLLIALFFACCGCQKRNYAEELDSIQARLTLIEQRLTQLEKMEQKISTFEFRLKELQKSVSRLDNLIAEIPRAPQAIKTQPNEQSEGRYHTVNPGDSLSHIARENGLSVEELRRFNNLTEDQVIYPGQKLLLEPGSTQ